MQDYKLIAIPAALIAIAVAGIYAVRWYNKPKMADVGSKPRYTFSGRILNGRGIRSLADLRGRPTLVEFWAVA